MSKKKKTYEIDHGASLEEYLALIEELGEDTDEEITWVMKEVVEDDANESSDDE